MGMTTIGAIRYGAAVATVPLSIAWGIASVLAHHKPQNSNDIVNFLLQKQHLIAASIFGTVTTSAFLNMYPLRTLFFGLASLASLLGYISQNSSTNKENKSLENPNIEWLEATIIGCMGLAAFSKCNVLGIPHSEKLQNHNFEFPEVKNLGEVATGWRRNLSAEINIFKWNIQNSPLLFRDLFVGVSSGIKNMVNPTQEMRKLSLLNRFRGAIETNAPNCYRGAFQITGLMRLSAFGLLLASVFTKKDENTQTANTNNEENQIQNVDRTNETNSLKDTAQPEKHKQQLLSQIAAWLISFSLIPAGISALSINKKWGNIPNLLFNASSLLAIPGLGLKLLPVGDFGQIAGALCTKLLIAVQMLAYALSQISVAPKKKEARFARA
jgi:hypothetical protein